MSSTATQPAPAAAPSLLGAAVQGVKWTTLATVLTSVLQLGYTAVMARLLNPADFGLVALAGIFMRFGSYFAQLGMEQAIIQKATLTATDIRAAFTTSVGLGLVFTGVLALAAPLAALLFAQPGVVPLVQCLSLGLLLTGLYATAVSLLRRQMRFRTLALIEVAAFVVSYGGVGIGLALAGAGPWSLVGAQLGQTLLTVVLAYAATRHPVRPLFDWAVYRPLVQYGGWSSVAGFCEYMTGELDKMSISHGWGAAALGLYSRAWMLIGLPIYTLSASVARVALPSFSQVQHDRPRLRGAYLRSLVLIGVLIVPLCLGAAVAAPEIVALVLGPRWLAAIPLFQLICVVFSLSMLNMFAATVCDATATLARKLWLTLTHAAVLLLLFALLRPLGLLGVAVGVLAAELLRTALYWWLMHRVLGVRATELLRSYWPALRTGGGVALAIAGVAAAVRPLGWPLPVVLGLEMLAGAGALLLLAVVLAPPLLRATLRPLLPHLPRPAHPAAGRLLGWLQQHLAAPEAALAAAPLS